MSTITILDEKWWYEVLHPRVPKGQPTGGEWRDKNAYMAYAKPIQRIGTQPKKIPGKFLHNAFVDLLNMPYFKNQAAKSGKYNMGHEEAVADVLINNGFKRIIHNPKEIPEGHDPKNYLIQDQKLGKYFVKKWLEDHDMTGINKVLSNMPPGTFLLQPLGSQSFPDLIIKSTTGKLLALECKSVQGGKPAWNDNLPKLEAFYILASETYNTSTMFQGKDVITQDEIDFCKEYVVEMKEKAKEANEKLHKKDVHKRQWAVYPRTKYDQMGSASNTDFFLHRERAMCENNVLAAALKLS